MTQPAKKRRLLTIDEAAGVVSGLEATCFEVFCSHFWLIMASLRAHTTAGPCQAVAEILEEEMEVMDVPGDGEMEGVLSPPHLSPTEPAFHP